MHPGTLADLAEQSGEGVYPAHHHQDGESGAVWHQGRRLFPLTRSRCASRGSSRRDARAFVPYVTAGHPDPGAERRAAAGARGAGADVIEVGVPFSDPLADGAVIQASSQHGARPRACASTRCSRSSPGGAVDSGRAVQLPQSAAARRRRCAAARRGRRRARRARHRPARSAPIRSARRGSARPAGLHSTRRADHAARRGWREIARTGSGFVYLISRLGVTGEQATCPPELPATAARLRAATSLPICVGFGISTAGAGARGGARSPTAWWSAARSCVPPTKAWMRRCRSRGSLRRGIDDA